MIYTAASNLGRETDGAFIIVTGVCLALLFIITALMLYFTVRYRSSRSPRAEQIEGNTPLEIIWTIGGIVLVLILFYVGWGGYRDRAEVPDDAMEVDVTARQWSWLFGYRGGRESDVLVLPVDRPVKLVMRSEDVIHSLYIPAFRVKQDVVPGSEKVMWFTPDTVGEYELFCAEYCGTSHSHMLTTVRVVPGPDFDTWVKPAAAGAPDGEELYRTKGCSGCHTVDGSPLVGPSWKGLYGKEVTVVTNGKKRTVTVDDEYIHRSEVDPGADVVEGFPDVMPSQKGVLTDAEIAAIIEYIKGLR